MQRFRASANAMDLQADEPSAGHVISQIGHLDAIDPDLDPVALADHAIRVPNIFLELLSNFRAWTLRVEEFGPARLVVDSAGESVDGNLYLVAVDTAILVIRFALASDLNS